jgi:hypothetical protein
MVTVKADNRRRVQLPDVKPGQIFAVQDNGDDTITLTRVKAERKEPFPPGSLHKLVDEMNREWAGVKPNVPEPEDRD